MDRENPTKTSIVTVHHTQARSAKAVPYLLSIKQAIYELGISRTALYELIADEKLKTVKIGRRRLVPLESIEAFIADLRK